MSNRDGNPEIYVVNRDGSGMRRLTYHPENDVTPTWAPSGNQIAFTSNRTGRPQIWIMNADGSGQQKITNESWCDRPTWSPAPFNEIAYASQSGGGYDIRIYDFATRNTRTITDGIGSNESPAFSPNGRHLAFTSTRAGKAQIFTIAPRRQRTASRSRRRATIDILTGQTERDTNDAEVTSDANRGISERGDPCADDQRVREEDAAGGQTDNSASRRHRAHHRPPAPPTPVTEPQPVPVEPTRRYARHTRPR